MSAEPFTSTTTSQAFEFLQLPRMALISLDGMEARMVSSPDLKIFRSRGMLLALLYCWVGTTPGILPVAHPGQCHMAAFGSIVESHRGIMVFAVVHPFGRRGLGVAHEAVTIERSREILRGTSTERTTGVDIQQEPPSRTAKL